MNGEELGAENVRRSVDIRSILEERGKRYGSFMDHSQLAQDFKKIIQDGSSYVMLEPFQVEALEMICHKIARILNGNPDYIDSWADIGGYAQLVVDILEKAEDTRCCD